MNALNNWQYTTWRITISAGGELAGNHIITIMIETTLCTPLFNMVFIKVVCPSHYHLINSWHINMLK